MICSLVEVARCREGDVLAYYHHLRDIPYDYRSLSPIRRTSSNRRRRFICLSLRYCPQACEYQWPRSSNQRHYRRVGALHWPIAGSRTLTALAETGFAPKIFTYVDKSSRPVPSVIAILIFGPIAYVNTTQDASRRPQTSAYTYSSISHALLKLGA